MTLDLFQFNYSLTHTHLTLQIHLILGIGGFNNNFEPYEKGVMGDVAASANDPIFINHHTMVDCILEEWLQAQQNNRNVDYPANQTIRKGHRRNDYIVPFIPLYTHNMMFKRADSFGYSCNIPDAAPSTAPTTAPTTQQPPRTQPRSTTATTASAQSTTALYLLILAIIGIITLIL